VKIRLAWRLVSTSMHIFRTVPLSGIDPLELRKVIMTITGYDNGFNSTQKNPGDPGYGMTKNNTVAGPGTIAAGPIMVSFWHENGHTRLWTRGRSGLRREI